MTVPTFGQWIEWVFRGPEPEYDQLWDETLGRHVDWQLDHATTLFLRPSFLIGFFPERELRKGFWRLPYSWELSDLIWRQDVEWKRRRACIEAMYPLFRDLFARLPLKNTCFMWWDSFRYFQSDPDQRVVETQLRVLTRILALPSEDCQVAALHGLGHLEHDGKRSPIAAYLAQPDLGHEVRSYAAAALAGRVL